MSSWEKCGQNALGEKRKESRTGSEESVGGPRGGLAISCPMGAAIHCDLC